MPILERLCALPELAAVPREQLQWLRDHGELVRADHGAIFRGVGEELIGLFLLISGRFSVRVMQGVVEREVREVTSGGVTGHLPYSRMATPRGYLVADGPVEFLFIPLGKFPEMTRACYEFTAICVHDMLTRVRDFKADDKRQEKMAALGRLSAGLAHELNNPASAAARAARELDTARAELVAATRELSAAGLTGHSLAAFDSLEAVPRRSGSDPLSALQRADLQEGVEEWLGERRVGTHLADPLMERGITVEDLETATAALDAAQLALVLRYLAADRIVRALATDISSAAERIHSLVAAVKKHTQMDRDRGAEPTRIEEHLADTITLMSAKAALQGISLELSAESGLPTVQASVAELNQVWMHLIDNAIDAVGESGRIAIAASHDRDCIVVSIVDDGPGIPREHQERVFEPFFTTKDVGEGRGLGLDIARNVVRDHRGSIHLTSVPGRTEFRVTLPTGDAERRSG